MTTPTTLVITIASPTVVTTERPRPPHSTSATEATGDVNTAGSSAANERCTASATAR